MVTPPAVVAEAVHADWSVEAVEAAPYQDHCHW
jgi:hypothetical protein